MTEPDKDPKKPFKTVTPVSDDPALAMGISSPAPRPIRFPKLLPRGNTFIDPELRMNWDYLTDFFKS